MAAQRESNGLGGGGDRDTVREESKVGRFECVGAWELVLCVALCCLGVCVCVYVPSHLKHSRQGSLCLS